MARTMPAWKSSSTTAPRRRHLRELASAEPSALEELKKAGKHALADIQESIDDWLCRRR